MLRLCLGYSFIHLNVLCLNAYLLGIFDGKLVMAQQVSLFVWGYWNIWKESQRQLPLQKRILWLLVGLLFMMILSIGFGLLSPEKSNNQEIITIVQHQIPFKLFSLFLLTASVMEEYFYRLLLWNRIHGSVCQIGATTVLFALSHYPDTILTGLIYASLGLCLGFVRLRTDCLTSTWLHLSWNGLVLLLSFL